MRELTYKQTDNDIELIIFGLKFKINEEEIEKIISKKQDEIEEEAEKNKNYVNDLIDKILGNGSVDKINNRRNEDGYEIMSAKIQMQVFGFICEKYAEVVLNPINRATTNINNFKNKKRYNKNFRR